MINKFGIIIITIGIVILLDRAKIVDLRGRNLDTHICCNRF